MELVFATNNQNKLREVQTLLKNNINLLSLKNINCFEEIPEDYDTIEENALQKAKYIFDKYELNCFADDTALEIDHLNGEPGVISARYASPSCSPEDNMQKVLKKLEGVSNRKARFRTVISLILNKQEFFFEGTVEGNILTKKQGTQGFGYDPIFKPDGFNKSFAEMPTSEKNKISHRGRATEKLIEFLGYDINKC